uniref:Selenoprotein F n=1 Tax=Gouania willdenowi TaxID=441366 RepID=A0A8C5DFR3_GOUWI
MFVVTLSSPPPLLIPPAMLSAYGFDMSSEACRELGFSSNLLCSSCDLLGEFSLSKLQPTCGQCCQQEALMEARKLYAGAILEVCELCSSFRKPKKWYHVITWAFILFCLIHFNNLNVSAYA